MRGDSTLQTTVICDTFLVLRYNTKHPIAYAVGLLHSLCISLHDYYYSDTGMRDITVRNGPPSVVGALKPEREPVRVRRRVGHNDIHGYIPRQGLRVARRAR